MDMAYQTGYAVMEAHTDPTVQEDIICSSSRRPGIQSRFSSLRKALRGGLRELQGR